MNRGGIGESSSAACKPAHRACQRQALALLLLLGAAGAAQAQLTGGPVGGSSAGGSFGGPMGGGRGNHQGQALKAPPPAPPAPVAPEPWPRLDVGAIFCKSRDDLVTYQTQTTNGGAGSSQPVSCTLIHALTAIQILDRDGPSRTHVVTTDASKQSGWTNAYLPATAPASANAASARR